MRRRLLTLATLLAVTPGAVAEPKRNLAEYVRDAVVRCWNVPADAMDAGPITIRFKLDRHGKVVGTPEADQALVAHFKLDANRKIIGRPKVSAAPQDKKRETLIRSGVRAIQKCSPFPELPKIAPYDKWSEIAVTLDSRELR